MTYTRRQFGKLAATTLPFAAAAASYPRSLFAQGKPDSVFGGVQVGIITAYSYHNMPDDARSLVSYMVRDGISATESHDEPLAEFLGAPKAPVRPRPVSAPAGAERLVGGPPAGEPRAPHAPSPEQLAYLEALNKWRLATPPAKFGEVRKLYNDAGISIYGFKMSLTNAMPDELYDWTFEVVKVLGANQLTMEMPDGDSALTARIGKFALKHKTRVGYHAHLQATPTTWDEAMSQSPYNCINLDIGHYTAAGNHDVVAFVQKNHERITSVHLKDRKFKENGGENMPWGQGDTPIKDVLALMKKDKYRFPATIELEYRPPEGSDSEKEIVKCLAYAKAALA